MSSSVVGINPSNLVRPLAVAGLHFDISPEALAEAVEQASVVPGLAQVIDLRIERDLKSPEAEVQWLVRECGFRL